MTRKFTFLMTAMALILAIMGPRSVAWGQTTTYTMQSYSNNVITSDNNATWATSSACGGSELPYALNSKRGAGFQANNTVTSSFTVTNASKISVVASSNGNKTTTLAVKVGNTTFGNTVSVPQQNYQTLEFTAPNNTPVSGTIVFTITRSSKTLWIGQVIVETASTPSTVAAPTFNPAAGTYYEDQTIVLSAEEGCTIHYTTDGTTPTVESEEYEDAIQLTVPSTTTIKAIAVDGENNSSNVASATYTLKRSQYTPAQLLAEVEPDNQQYTVVFNNETITEFYLYNSQKRGFYIETGEEDFLTYCSGTPTDWEVGGKVSGTVTGIWKTYSNLKEFCPEDYDDFSYTQPTQQLPAPTGLTVSDLNMTEATLSWNAVEHANSYTVYVTDLDAYENTIEDIETTSVVLDDLTAGTEYMWTVQAIGDGEIYLDSEIAEGEVFETPTTVLYNVTIAPADGGTIKAQIDSEDITQAANGATVNLIATPGTHFTFTSWNVYGTDEPHTTVTVTDNAFTMPAYDVTVTATFTEEAKYTVTYAKGGDDVTGEIPTVASYYAGETVEVAENPFSYVGHTFNGWSFNPIVEIVNIDDVDYFEMPASNVTVTATWAEKTPATITLMDKGAQYGETINGYVGDNLLATLTAAGVENPTGLATMPDYEFAGWAQSNSTETPNIVTEETTITGDATLYAIYANVIIGTTTYQKVNSLSDIVAGRWVIVNDGYALPSTTTGSSNPPVKSNDFKVTVSDNQISSTVSANMIWNFAISEGKATITNSENDYLYAINDNNGLRVSTTEDTWTFETNSTGFAMKDSSKSRYCATYKSGSDWRSYTSKDHSNYGDSGILYLYKENTTPDIIIYDFEESAKTLTVTYDANGAEGEVPVEAMLFAQGDEYTLESADGLTKAHHTFAGWKADTDEQIYAVGSTYTFGETSVTFTAQWEEETKYTVSYHVNGVVSTNDVYAGELQLTAPANVPNGYTYVGYANEEISGVAESASYFSSYNVTENVDLYAVFAMVVGGGTTSVTKDIIAEAGITSSVTLNADNNPYQMGELPITLTGIKGQSNFPALNYNATNGTDLRFYKGTTCGVTFATTNNSTITKIEFKKNAETASNLGTSFSANAGTLSANVWTGSAESVTISYSADATFKEQMYIINVTYSESAPSTYSNFCTSVTALSGNLADATTVANTAYYISEAATVEGEVTINGVLGNADASLLIINDGAQLIHHNAGVVATVQKNITGYTNAQGNDGYYLIANPTERVPNDEYDVLDGATSGFDLYTFDPTEESEWRNKVGTVSRIPFERTVGYLFAVPNNRTMSFRGSILPAGTMDIDLVYAEEGDGIDFPGFNLLGNPYACNAYVNKPALRLDDTGSEFIAVVGAINPCEGFFVEARSDDRTVTISTEEPGTAPSSLSLTVSQNRGQAIDRAIVSFNDNSNLHKFMLNPAHTNISLAKGSESFAAVSTEAEGEVPVNFKAEKNGSYTITVNTENVDAEYLHLIDNMTGMDTDLLSTPSYTFEAKTSDYASRFKLVFNVKNEEANGSSDNNFAFMSDGNLVISNIEGEATLQIVDQLGRVLSTKTVSGSYNKALNLKAGLYIINLNGMTQKIVVK